MKEIEHMRILAISGSLNANGTITTFVRAVAALAPAHMTVTLYDGLGDLPHFSPDRDGDDAPAAVTDLRALTVPLVRTKMATDGAVTDAATAQALRSVLDALARVIRAHGDTALT
jgi:hypothetical protein